MEHFIAELERYAADRGWTLGTLCYKINGDDRLYARLKAGGSCTICTVEKYRAYIAANPAPAPPTLPSATSCVTENPPSQVSRSARDA